jgi:hypothetical protein
MSNLLLETGDALLLETGDNILLNEVAPVIAVLAPPGTALTTGSTIYRVDVCTPAGVKIEELGAVDLLSLEYTKQVCAPGIAELMIPGSHRLVSAIEDKAQILVYRRNDAWGLPWTNDFAGIYRKPKRTYEDGIDQFTITAPGIMEKLRWRHVLFFAGTANRSSFTGAEVETIMKTLVRYNATSDATVSNGRLRTAGSLGISVEASSGVARLAVSKDCAWDNLLEILQKLADSNDPTTHVRVGDFDLIKTGANTFEFRFYAGQRGTDRRNAVKFSLGLGNMASPVYEYDKTDEVTVAFVAGDGEGVLRQYDIVTGPDYNASTNDIESFEDQKSLTTSAGRIAVGREKLEEKRAKETFEHDVVQTSACAYGVHYFLGDLVTVDWFGSSKVEKIVSVTVTLDEESGEKIKLEKQSIVAA